MKFQQDAERKNFPDGLAMRSKFFQLAPQEAEDGFNATYNV